MKYIIRLVAALSLISLPQLALAQSISSYDGFSYTEPNTAAATFNNQETDIPCGHANQVGLFDSTGFSQSSFERGLATEKQTKSPLDLANEVINPCP